MKSDHREQSNFNGLFQEVLVGFEVVALQDILKFVFGLARWKACNFELILIVASPFVNASWAWSNIVALCVCLWLLRLLETLAYEQREDLVLGNQEAIVVFIVFQIKGSIVISSNIHGLHSLKACGCQRGRIIAYLLIHRRWKLYLCWKRQFMGPQPTFCKSNELQSRTEPSVLSFLKSTGVIDEGRACVLFAQMEAWKIIT